LQTVKGDVSVIPEGQFWISGQKRQKKKGSMYGVMEFGTYKGKGGLVLSRKQVSERN
jgi:hypothetical protein